MRYFPSKLHYFHNFLCLISCNYGPTLDRLSVLEALAAPNAMYATIIQSWPGPSPATDFVLPAFANMKKARCREAVSIPQDALPLKFRC